MQGTLGACDLLGALRQPAQDTEAANANFQGREKGEKEKWLVKQERWA